MHAEQHVEDVNASKPILSVLQGRRQNKIPFWFMRQAGRYLPEYQEIRSKAGSFLDLVYNPDLATEVTLQPLRRFDTDAVILFSDILVVPQALGQKLNFVEGEGPKLDPVRSEADLTTLSMAMFEKVTSPVYETVEKVSGQLVHEGYKQKTLIGFAGAPWTVATYMVEGGSSRDFTHVKRWAYSNPEGFRSLTDLITSATIEYLKRQIEAGAEVIQLFDSWAGVVDETLFNQHVILPTRKIVEALREGYPDVPVIGFPKGAGRFYVDYVRMTGVSAVSIDFQIAPSWAAAALQPVLPVQGNLDPVCLLAGGDSLAMAVENIIGNLGMGPFIFNLGHGIHKDTPVEHVEQLTNLIRAYS